MDIQEILKRQEGKTLEFKRDLSSPERIIRAITAFANMAALEAEINSLVYKLYDLTPEEINIVDPASAVAPKASSVAEAVMEDKMADGSRGAFSFAEATVDKTQGKGETA